MILSHFKKQNSNTNFYYFLSQFYHSHSSYFIIPTAHIVPIAFLCYFDKAISKFLFGIFACFMLEFFVYLSPLFCICSEGERIWKALVKNGIYRVAQNFWIWVWLPQNLGILNFGFEF